MDLVRLRAETRSQHEAVEALLPLTSPQLTRESYGGILLCMYGIVSTWEAWAEVHAPTSLADMVTTRKRATLLGSDIRFLGKNTPSTVFAIAEQSFFPSTNQSGKATEPAFLGAMYVIEGSTLGGQYIAKHVEGILALEPGKGNAYFHGYGQQTGAMWRTFQNFLKELPEAEADEVIAAARAMFEYFAMNIRSCPAATSLSQVL